jgi:hypothetical protein
MQVIEKGRRVGGRRGEEREEEKGATDPSFVC